MNEAFGNTRLAPYELIVLKANFHRGNSRFLSARILQRDPDVIGALERYHNCFRKLGHHLRGKKQTPEHVAKRVAGWGRKKQKGDVHEIGNNY